MTSMIYHTWILVVFAWISQTNAAFPEPQLFWSVTEENGAQSCLYSISGDPSTWITPLSQGGEVVADPLCVNKSLFEFGPIAADLEITRKVFTYDRLGGGLTRFAAYQGGDVESFFPAANELRDLAVDWISQNVYFTHPEVGIAMASYKDSDSHFRVLLDAVDNPLGIAVDPHEGSVFWVDAGSGKLQLLPLEGGAPIAVVTDLTSPTWLAADRQQRALYWMDDVTNSVMTCTYGGENVRSAVNSTDITPGVFSGIEVYNNYIFGLVEKQAAVVIWDKTTGDQITILHFNDGSNVTQRGISMTIPDDITVDNLCDLDNGECGHICVYGGRDLRHCVCDFGFELVEKDCYATGYLRDNFLLVSDMGSSRLYQISLTDPGDVRGIPIQKTQGQRVEGVTYDPVQRHIYWTDTGNRTLRRTRLLARNAREEVLYTFPAASLVEGITFDTYDRCLYYTDLGLSVIGRIDISTGAQEDVLSLGSSSYPLAIHADTQLRYLYWTDIGFPAKVERVHIPDGSDRQVVIDTDITSPTSVAVDLEGLMVYWVDEYEDKLVQIRPDGNSQEVHRTTPGSFKMTMDDTYIYMTFLHEIRRYSSFDFSTYTNMGPKFFSNIFDVHLYSSTYTGQTKPPTVTPSTTKPTGGATNPAGTTTTKRPSSGAAIHNGLTSILVIQGAILIMLAL